MANKAERQADDLLTLTKSVFIELPLAGMRWRWGSGAEAAVMETAWKGYDAGVRLTTAAIDNLYRLPLYGAVLRGAAPVFLRWQRVSNAIIGAAAAGLWQAVGLSTKAETRALQEVVAHLGAELRAQRQENEALISLATRIVQALEADESPIVTLDGVKSHTMDEKQVKPTLPSTSQQKGH